MGLARDVRLIRPPEAHERGHRVPSQGMVIDETTERQGSRRMLGDTVPIRMGRSPARSGPGRPISRSATVSRSAPRLPLIRRSDRCDHPCPQSLRRRSRGSCSRSPRRSARRGPESQTPDPSRSTDCPRCIAPSATSARARDWPDAAHPTLTSPSPAHQARHRAGPRSRSRSSAPPPTDRDRARRLAQARHDPRMALLAEAAGISSSTAHGRPVAHRIVERRPYEGP